MNLIIISGSGAVGKMTVGQKLMKITDYRLFHNHMMIEPVIEIFGKFDGAMINKLREDIFDGFIRSDNEGMIFTFMWAFDMQSDWDYITGVAKKFEESGGTVYWVELVADQAVRLERNKTANRLANKASKRNIEISQDRMIREETKYRLVSREGEIPFEHYIKIDNTNLEPDQVANIIKSHFGLPDKSDRAVARELKLELAREDELEQLLQIQKESFQPLYEKYHDEGSPAIETIERIRARAQAPNRNYYFIVYKGARIGAVNIGYKPSEADETILYISPIFISPKYQNQGFGYLALQAAFRMHPEATKWRLTTILQEPMNCHLYEKCGFVRTGKEEVINDSMTLIEYEKQCKR